MEFGPRPVLLPVRISKEDEVKAVLGHRHRRAHLGHAEGARVERLSGPDVVPAQGDVGQVEGLACFKAANNLITE